MDVHRRAHLWSTTRRGEDGGQDTVGILCSGTHSLTRRITHHPTWYRGSSPGSVSE